MRREEEVFDSATTATSERRRSDLLSFSLSLLMYLFYPLLFYRGELGQERGQVLGSRSDRGHLELRSRGERMSAPKNTALALARSSRRKK